MDTSDIIVTGDSGISRYVYIKSLPDEEANLREAWVDAQDFVTLAVDGGAAHLARCLQAKWITEQADIQEEPLLESIYLLTKHTGDDNDDPEQAPWKVGLAIVAGQRQVTFKTVRPADLLEMAPEGAPLVVVDFHQGWVNSNGGHLAQLIGDRPYLIRTHDPVTMVGAGPDVSEDFWKDIRQEVDRPGVWFSPWQDMAAGGLRVAGNWDTVCNNITQYLQGDGEGGLYTNNAWQHHVIIQISYDGALVLSPPDQETILRFPCDQPESFKKRSSGTVVGGGTCIAASVAEALCSELTHDALVQQAAVGLARARDLVESGYSEPSIESRRDPRGDPTWDPFPAHVRNGSPAGDRPVVREDIMAEAEADNRFIRDRAEEIITTNDKCFRKLVVYQMGKLYTCDPLFAEQLIRLEERIQSHLNSDDEDVMSFAVLGNPGSGKSFAAEQLLETVGGNLEAIEFNVSQFTSDDLLVDAFRQIQTISLQGKVPFVLWDEFDCVHDEEVGGWLSRFLMPMEDAVFWYGGERAQLGKCVFVFVGSAWSTKDEFEAWVQMSAQADDVKSTSAGRVAPGLKGRDFQSRLDRILEVPSVTLRSYQTSGTTDEHQGDSEKHFDCSQLTRALMIRLTLGNTGVRQVDEDVIDLLLTANLRHGMRSLRAIIEASQLDRTDRFSWYHLPPAEVMDVHVSGFDPDVRPTAMATPRLLKWTEG